MLPSCRYNTLSFTLQGYADGDVLHVAHCYPYSYTDLQRHLAVSYWLSWQHAWHV